MTACFAVLNIIAFFHAYKFTHFSETSTSKTKSSNQLNTIEKLKVMLVGVSNPKPINTIFPTQPYSAITLQSNKAIECWEQKVEDSKGIVLLFHGYGGNKSSMLDKATEFHKLGFSTLLVDFMGSGGSSGNQTTIGFFEAEQVKLCFDYVVKKGEKNILLFGTSMGAVAIMKAINDYMLSPTGIIIECPFGSMYETVCARFNTLNIPSFPMAGLLVFWGGIQNGFWAFNHKPSDYALKIECPTLLLYGEKDEKVSITETTLIFNNLKGKKKLKTYPEAGHENYLKKYKSQWTTDISNFINQDCNIKW